MPHLEIDNHLQVVVGFWRQPPQLFWPIQLLLKRLLEASASVCPVVVV